MSWFMAIAPSDRPRPTRPTDHIGARNFSEATKDMGVKEIAAACKVPVSLVSRWRHEGHVPDWQVDRLPPDVQQRYGELQGRRWGAWVIERHVAEGVVRFVAAAFPMLKASLESRDRDSLTRREGRVSVA